MKRIIALLLVLCMAFSLVACGKPADKTDGTGSSDAANNKDEGGKGGGGILIDYTHVENTGNFEASELESTGAAGVNATLLSNDDLINPDFKGKKIQIYGYNNAVFDDIDEMGQGSFIWMVRAAIDEWSALNQVEVEFVGGYDQNVILGDINGGGKPDLLIYCNKFPLVATTGIVRAFSDAEYEKLAETCGNYYLDMLKFKGKSVGVMSPWSGGTLFYYNKTMFEEYGAKSPKDYYMEGNWTWETAEKCFEAVTKDLDNDGKIDTYGSGCYFMLPEGYRLTIDNSGKITSTIDSQAMFDYFQLVYKGKQETKSLGSYLDATVATTPRPGTSCGDAEWYNFKHLNQELVNGDKIECIPMPKYKQDSESWYTHTPVFSSILASCDEPEATLSLLCYVLRVGMRYMSDYSLGLYKCNYEGIRGASQYSAAWKANFAEIVAERQSDFDLIDDWDQELYEKLQYDVLNADNHTFAMEFGTGAPTIANIGKEASTMPPASSIPLIKAREEAWIATYNGLYAS